MLTLNKSERVRQRHFWMNADGSVDFGVSRNLTPGERDTANEKAVRLYGGRWVRVPGCTASRAALGHRETVLVYRP